MSFKQTLVVNIFNYFMIKYSQILGIKAPNKTITQAVAWTFNPRHGMIEAHQFPVAVQKELVTRAKAKRWSFNPWPSVMLDQHPLASQDHSHKTLDYAAAAPKNT
jgi:hypothetical protein